MKAIRHWRKGKTTIILTHELSQIESDDYLYLMKEGEVVESGTQSELLADPTTTFSTWYHLQNDYSDAKTIVDTETEENLYTLWKVLTLNWKHQNLDHA